MKRLLNSIFLPLVALGVVTFVGCSKEPQMPLPDLGGVVPDVLYAEFDEVCSRTYIEENRYLRWTAGDEISYFPVITYNMRYRFTGKTGDNGGAFEKLTFDLVTGNGLDNCYAVYPYAATTTISEEGVMSFAYPDTQYYAKETFGLGANVMVAVTESKDDNLLRFKNACGYLKILLYGEGSVQRIELSGNRGEKIVGDAMIEVLGGLPHMSIVSGSTTMTLDCASGVELSATEPTPFWFAMPPVTFSEGITITIYDSMGRTMTKSTTKQVEIERNMVQPMAAFEFKVDDTPQGFTAMAGVWHLTEWAGAIPSFDVYLDIDASGRVALYQRISTLTWQMFESEATLSDDVISGVYTDGIAWGTSYRYTLNSTTMTWVNISDAGDTSVYTRSELPENVEVTRTDAFYGAERFL